MKNLQIMVAGAIAAAAMATGANAANLVTNGDFQAGDTGFTSAYTSLPGLLWDPAVYGVDTNPNNRHPYWASFGDHTSGAGEMMIINGADVANVEVWGESGISVAANTVYNFTAWVASSYYAAPAVLNLKINNVLASGNFTASSTTGQWDAFTVSWNSGLATTANLSLWNQNTAYGGNDFVLDDISFSSGGVPEPAAWALMLTGFGGMGAVLRRRRRMALAA